MLETAVTVAKLQCDNRIVLAKKMVHPLDVNRRSFLTSAAAAGAAVSLTASETAKAATSKASRQPRFRFCFNTSTIRGQSLPLNQEVELVAKAGYDGIEPWTRELEDYVKNGGSLKDLKKQIADSGLRVESVIGFARWIVDDIDERQAGLERAKRGMDLVRQIGGTRIAAPPVGATNGPALDLLQVAERYAALLSLGVGIGVIPQIEVWGFSRNLSRLGEAMFAAIESGHPDACLLPDVYHLYKGGSEFTGLKMVRGRSMHCFHINDYPANPPRETIGDKDRVYPGDGIAPLDVILQTLAETGFVGALSLELFNRDYWAQDAQEVARTGLEKTKEAVARALS